ncbi:MAG: hypothetical protein FWD90_05810 [Defluviitaleaceae bacterium]|nr:hypothetical protein [Defluviitaleaceae bacterium]
MNEKTSARGFFEMQPGEVFRAKIADIRQGSVTIRFDDGTEYTARSLVLPDARIGEESGFLVRENDFEGRIVLEMVKLPPEIKQDNMLREAMRHAGITVSPDSLAFGRRMLAAGIPVEAATLQNIALHRLADDPLALFSATPREIREITHALSRSTVRRNYYQIKPATEIHVFKTASETAIVITCETVSLGRIEATIKQTNGHPTRVSILCDCSQTLDLLADLPLLKRSSNIKSEKNSVISEPFTLLSPPPIANVTPQRFNLDIRV